MNHLNFSRSRHRQGSAEKDHDGLSVVIDTCLEAGQTGELEDQPELSPAEPAGTAVQAGKGEEQEADGRGQPAQEAERRQRTVGRIESGVRRDKEVFGRNEGNLGKDDSAVSPEQRIRVCL